jgi:hypothetical protein
VRRIYDVHAERPVTPVVGSAADAQVVVFDGIFLHRPELREFEVDFDVSIPRGAGRGYGDPDVGRGIEPSLHRSSTAPPRHLPAASAFRLNRRQQPSRGRPHQGQT